MRKINYFKYKMLFYLMLFHNIILLYLIFQALNNNRKVFIFYK